jgi:uncharacterized membrane protein
MARGVNYPFFFSNGLLLLTVTFLPFPTAVLAQNLATAQARPAATFYCATMVANALSWNVLFRAIVNGGLLRKEVTAATVDSIQRTYYVGLLVYVAATVLAFVKPALGLALNGALCVVWIRLGYQSESSGSARPS